jgi:hypothetical protein
MLIGKTKVYFVTTMIAEKCTNVQISEFTRSFKMFPEHGKTSPKCNRMQATTFVIGCGVCPLRRRGCEVEMITRIPCSILREGGELTFDVDVSFSDAGEIED